MVGAVGLEPTILSAEDFKSSVYAIPPRARYLFSVVLFIIFVNRYLLRWIVTSQLLTSHFNPNCDASLTQVNAVNQHSVCIVSRASQRPVFCSNVLTSIISIVVVNIVILSIWCPKGDLNSHSEELGFEPSASTCSAIGAILFLVDSNALAIVPIAATMPSQRNTTFNRSEQVECPSFAIIGLWRNLFVKRA
jgi:hypothetical protein